MAVMSTRTFTTVVMSDWSSLPEAIAPVSFSVASVMDSKTDSTMARFFAWSAAISKEAST